MRNAFISYARVDKPFVDKHVKPILKVLGIELWMDTDDLHGSEDWKRTIDQALIDCDFFLLICTTAAAASPAVRGEAEWIIHNRRNRILPILGETIQFDAIHAELPHIHHIDCVNTDHKHSATRLARGIYQLAARVAVENERKYSQCLQRESELNIEHDAIKLELNALTNQLEDLQSINGGWDGPAKGEVAPFIPRTNRNAPIIMTMNLKGGVGKSTISANLAATWWGRAIDPKRVLLIDLDYQRSVTSLCISARDLSDLEQGKLFVNAIFDEQTDAAEHFLKARRRVGRGEGYLLGANEVLTRVESHVEARWLTGQTDNDVRFLLRKLLHSSAIQDRYDLIMIDCPPRISTASINALAASDFLLIPVLLDFTSSESAPRMLKWVSHYKKTIICPDLDLLGIVANKKSDRRSELLDRERNLLDTLPDRCRKEWGKPVRFFDTRIPNSSAIADAAMTPGQFACEDHRVKPYFDNLAEELEQYIDPSKGTSQ